MVAEDIDAKLAAIYGRRKLTGFRLFPGVDPGERHDVPPRSTTSPVQRSFLPVRLAAPT
jgi:hypothetical protein